MHVSLSFQHAVTVYLPLMDVDGNNGMVHVFPKSHIDTVSGSAQYSNSPRDSTAIGIPLEVGDALVWDYRLKHYGGENLSNKSRPIMTYVISKSWFVDRANTINDTVSVFDAVRPKVA
jgi:ectoine hydroxylase-related dioxygenase (phytanoyl-CoA dioxygenase family)